MGRLFGIMLFCAFVFPLTLAAQIGPDVSVYKGEQLKWEEGAHDFFVMWKSLVARTDGSVDTGPNNPQADSCVDPNVGSTYTLVDGTIPPNATIDRAFLIWMAVVDPTQLNNPVKNSATLSFQHSTEPSLSLTQEVTASISGMLANTSTKDFEFEGIKYKDPGGNDDAIFTYRVEVTDFMKKIQEDGNTLGMLDPTYTLVGNYNVKGVPCSADQIYKTSSGLMAGWSLVLIYTAEGVRAKKIYMYNGLMPYRYTSADIMIAGFQLPNEAEIRATLFVGEGDPGLYDSLNANLEGLQLHGPIDQSAPWAPIFNICNPQVNNYYEIYNSISSVYPWGSQDPICIGDFASKQLEYAMDVDTFLIRMKDYPFNEHLKKDDGVFWLKIGANQDQVYTNFLLLSIDTKPPSFDIPEGTEFAPDGREKALCTCAPANEPDRICPDRPFYYLLKIQNWGENVADNVKVQDTLPPEIEYVPGTTEMATEFAGISGTNWTAIPDSGGFPLNSPFEVHPSMGYCDPNTKVCPNTVYVRFKVRPKPDLPKTVVIRNTAYISDATGLNYQSNTSVPLSVRISNSCPPITECPEPPKASCGGEGGIPPSCTEDKDCNDPCKRCDNGSCVAIPDCGGGDLCSGAQIEYRAGDMSPSNGDAKIIIPASSQNLVVAQLMVKGTCAGDNKNFSLDMVRMKFETETGVILSNLRLVKDKDNNGAQSEGDVVVGTLSGLTAGYADFVVTQGERLLPANSDNNLLVLADTAYSGQTVPSNTTFRAVVEGKATFVITETGGAEVTNILDQKVEFATFMFEPSTGYFVFTKGPKEIPEPAHNQLNKSNPVLHIRAKSLDGDNQLRSIRIKTVGDSVDFGQGMQAITIWEDADGDGVGDTLLATSGTFSEPTSDYSFTDLETKAAFQFSDKQERYYTINITFSLEAEMTAQIEIPNLGVKLVDGAKKIIELPIRSRSYQCTEPFCYAPPSKGCSCAFVDIGGEDDGVLLTALMVVLSLGLFFGLRRGRKARPAGGRA